MLDIVEKILIENGYGPAKEIKDIKDTCCYHPTNARYFESKVLAYEFDEIKDVYYKRVEEAEDEKCLKPQSVDAIVFSKKQNILFFIEMKKFFPKPSGKLDCLTFVRSHFKPDHENEEHDSFIPQKLVDSYEIIKEIMRDCKIESKFWTYIKTKKRFKIVPVLVSNFTYGELTQILYGTADLRYKSWRKEPFHHRYLEIMVRITDIIEPGILILNCQQLNEMFAE